MTPEVELKISDLELPQDRAIFRRFLEKIYSITLLLQSCEMFGELTGEGHRFVICANPIQFWVTAFWVKNGESRSDELVRAATREAFRGHESPFLSLDEIVNSLFDAGILKVAE